MVTIYKAPEAPAPARVFDRALVRWRRNRAASCFSDHAFLHDHVTRDFAERLSAINRHFHRALDLGCHDGRLAGLGLAAHWVHADPGEHMARRAPRPALVADEEWLPVTDESFDLVASVLSLHAVNDLPGCLIQVNRALRPDGLFLGALFAGDTLHELRTVLREAEEAIVGEAQTRIAPFADIRDLGSLLQRGGFALPVTDSERLTVRYPDIFRLLADLRGMGEGNALALADRKPLRRDVLFRAASAYQDRFADADGRLRATFEIVTLTGWAPHESQQKPMRPGSARARLADALGTEERPAGEKAGS